MADSGTSDRRSGGHDPHGDGLEGYRDKTRNSLDGAELPSLEAHAAGRPSRRSARPLLLDQQFDAGSLGSMRAAVAAHAAAAGLAASRVRDAVIAAHELAANVIRHGTGSGRIRQWTDGKRLHCHVSDPGRPALPAADPVNQKPWLAEHGHGLWLVSQIADQVAIRRGHGSVDVTIIFAIRPA
jgi:anti-sigma regulatory factor (Ser/Thr protein kinase)